MERKIKNLFFNFIWTKRQLILAACPVAKRSLWFGVFFLIFLGLALPVQFAEAFFDLIGLAVGVTLINLGLQFILAISNLILGLAGIILSWVLSPYFTSLPYTYGGIVDIGWPIVRDFVNMFFIVALVIIGLATALRIKEYQAQKALPTLIIIAILINFTPVICGLIIDAVNIFMNFFLEELTGFKLLGNLFSAQGTMIWGAIKHFYNPLESISLMGKAIIMIIFDWVAAFIFFMYALLFIMRYIMIWVLVIVSPLAFFSRIFPGSQKYLFKSILGWDEWWKQFIEWSLIGVIGAFFLYLGEQLMVLAPGWISGIPPGGFWGVITTPLVDFINQLLPWGVALAFILIGFFTATSTSAMGAGFITGAAKKYGTMGAKAVGAFAKSRGLAAARAAVPESWRMRMETMAAAKAPAWGAGRKGVAGYALRSAAGMAGFARGKAAGAAVSAIAGGERTAAGKSEEEAKKRDVIGNLNALRDPTISDADRMGIIKGMVEAKQMRDALSEDVVGDKVLTADESFRAYKKARQLRDRDASEDMEWSFAHMKGVPERFATLVDQETASAKEEKDRTGELYGRPSGLSEDDVKLYGYTSYQDKIIRSAKTADDMKKFHKSLWGQKETIESALHFDGHQIGAATAQFGSAFSNPLQAAAEEKGINWFHEINPLTGKMRAPKLPRYFQSVAAQGVYMPLAGGETRGEVQAKEREGRKKQKPFLERELRGAEEELERLEAQPTPDPVVIGNTRTRISQLKRDIEEIERLEQEEREKLVAAPPIEEPLAARIKKAKGKEKEILERAFDRLKKSAPDVAKLETDISKLDDEIAKSEAEAKRMADEIQRMVRIERAPEETIRPFREALATKQREIEEKKGEKEKSMTEWRTRISAWRAAHPEITAAQEITRLKEMEETTKKTISRMKTLGRPKADIEKTEADLQEIKDTKTSWEGRLATHFRSEELGSKMEETRERVEDQKPHVDKMKGEVRSLDSQVDGVDGEIKSINKGITSQQKELADVKRERRKLVAQVKEEIILEASKETPEERRRLLDKKGRVLRGVLRERERSDYRFQPLDEKIKAIPGTMKTLRNQSKSRSTDLRELTTRRRKAERRYEALSREVDAMEREIGEVEGETRRIESGEGLMGRRVGEMSEDEKREFESYLKYRGNLTRRKSIQERMKKLLEEETK